MLTNDVVSFEQLGPELQIRGSTEHDSKIDETVLMKGQQYTAVLQWLEQL